MASLWQLFVQIEGDNSGFKKSVKDAQGDLTDFEKSASYATSRIADAFSSLGLKMSGVGISAFVMKSGKDFQDFSNQIEKATGQTGESLDGLNQVFKSLYGTSARSGEEIAAGLSKLAVETKQTGDSLEALAAASLRFAKVTSSDLAGSIEETQTVFKQFNIAAADQSDALDVLYATMTQTGISLGALSGQMAAVGPTTRSFGMSFVETAALVGAFSEAGLNASDVTRGLNALLLKFAEAGKDPKQALAELIEKLRDSATQTQALNELVDAGFAKRAAVAMADAARRGALDLGELTKKLTDSKGKVKDVADQTSSFTDELKKLGHEASLVGAGIGQPVVEAFTGILKAIREANDAFAQFEANSLKWLDDRGFFSIIGPIGNAVNNALNPWAKGNYINNWANPPAPKLPTGPVSTNLSAPLPGSGGASGVVGDASEEIKKLFTALDALTTASSRGGLKNLQKDLDDGLVAFQKLAEQGMLTQNQMLKVAEAIQKVRVELGQVKVDPGYLAFVADLGQQWASGPTNKLPTLDDLRNLPSGIHGGVTQDDLAALPQYAHYADIARDSLTALANELNLVARNQGIVTDAFHSFGLKTRDELMQDVQAAEDNFNTIKESGVDAPDVIGKAWAQMFKAKLALQLRDKQITQQEYDELVKQTDAAFGKMGASARNYSRTMGDELKSAMGSAMEQLERNLAQNIVEWKGWGDSVKNLGKTVAEDVLESFMKGLFNPLTKELEALGKKLGDLFGSIFGVKGNGGLSGTDVAGGGDGGGIGGAAGAGSGIAGALTAVGSIGSMISGIVGNFQFSGMNKSLDVLVNHTLRIYNELFNFRADAWTREGHWYARTSDMWQTLLDIKDTLGRGISTTSGRGGVTLNNCTIYGMDARQVAEAIFDQASLAGAIG